MEEVKSGVYKEEAEEGGRLMDSNEEKKEAECEENG